MRGGIGAGKHITTLTTNAGGLPACGVRPVNCGS